MERLGFGCEFFSGDHTREETPDPISNSEAKLPRADGTAGPARGRVGCRREVFDTPHFGGAFLFFETFILQDRVPCILAKGDLPWHEKPLSF